MMDELSKRIIGCSADLFRYFQRADRVSLRLPSSDQVCLRLPSSDIDDFEPGPCWYAYVLSGVYLQMILHQIYDTSAIQLSVTSGDSAFFAAVYGDNFAIIGSRKRSRDPMPEVSNDTCNDAIRDPISQ